MKDSGGRNRIMQCDEDTRGVGIDYMSFTRGISFPGLRSLLVLILAFSPP